jgi:hypothetical protein
VLAIEKKILGDRSHAWVRSRGNVALVFAPTYVRVSLWVRSSRLQLGYRATLSCEPKLQEIIHAQTRANVVHTPGCPPALRMLVPCALGSRSTYKIPSLLDHFSEVYSAVDSLYHSFYLIFSLLPGIQFNEPRRVITASDLFLLILNKH